MAGAMRLSFGGTAGGWRARTDGGDGSRLLAAPIDPVAVAHTVREAHQRVRTEVYGPGLDHLLAERILSSVGREVANVVQLPLQRAFLEAMLRATLRSRYGVEAGDAYYAASNE